MAQKYGVDLLGSLPLDIKIREQADGGRPTVVAELVSCLYCDSARVRFLPGRGAEPQVRVMVPRVTRCPAPSHCRAVRMTCRSTLSMS